MHTQHHPTLLHRARQTRAEQRKAGKLTINPPMKALLKNHRLKPPPPLPLTLSLRDLRFRPLNKRKLLVRHDIDRGHDEEHVLR